MWKAAAMERARRALRREAAGGVHGEKDRSNNNDNHSNNTAAHTSGGMSLEERAREKVVEEGPGSEALTAVGLIRDKEEAFQLSSMGGDSDGNGRGGWRLPQEVVEEMRRDFRRKLDEECTQVWMFSSSLSFASAGRGGCRQSSVGAC